MLERLRGPTMRVALLGGGLALTAGGEMLAALHTRLHTLPPRRRAGPDTRMLHLDLHPDNVMLEPRGPVVIDWRGRNPNLTEPELARLADAAAAVRSALVPGHG